MVLQDFVWVKRSFTEILCLPLMSKSENFGNVIVEALSQGTPAMASKGSPWQQLDEKGAGWWIDAKAECVGETVERNIERCGRNENDNFNHVQTLKTHKPAPDSKKIAVILHRKI